MSARALLAWVGCALCCAGCSTTRHVFVVPGYDVRGPDATKRVALVAWAPPNQHGLAEVLSAVAGDLVKLRKNYIVVGVGVAHQHWAEACADNKVQGVLLVRTLSQSGDAQAQALRLCVALLRCQDGALLWRAEGFAKARSDDAKLVTLVANYTSTLGVAASTYAAPAFVVLQDLVEALPNPVLSDTEVAEKLEFD